LVLRIGGFEVDEPRVVEVATQPATREEAPRADRGSLAHSAIELAAISAVLKVVAVGVAQHMLCDEDVWKVPGDELNSDKVCASHGKKMIKTKTQNEVFLK
jgi:hypothetical protein